MGAGNQLVFFHDWVDRGALQMITSDRKALMRLINVVAGCLCGIACIAAVAIYLFNFANEPLSSESLFWAMPMICPAAYAVYLKSKPLGAAGQLTLYALATTGAYHLIGADCKLGNCSTHNPAALLVASMVAGAHMIALLAAVVVMCLGAATTFKVNSVE